MTAYYVLTQTVIDPERYVTEYIPNVAPFLAKHGGEVLAAEMNATPVQGNPVSGVVVIRFPSEEKVQAFVNDPDYKPIKEIRLACTTDANAVMAPALRRP